MVGYPQRLLVIFVSLFLMLASVYSLAATPPDTPAISDVNVGDTLTTLTFPTPGDGGSALTGYTVTLSGSASAILVLPGTSLGSTASSGAYTATVSSISGLYTAITVTGLSNSGSYAFTVAASNGIGAGASSALSGTAKPSNVSYNKHFSPPGMAGVTSDSAGNVYIVGTFSSASVVIGSTTLYLLGASDGFVAKLDVNGNVLWAKDLGGSGAVTYASVVTTDGSGNVLIGGYFNSAGLSSPVVPLIGNQDAFVLNGQQWQYPLGQGLWRQHGRRSPRPASPLTAAAMLCWAPGSMSPASPRQRSPR